MQFSCRKCGVILEGLTCPECKVVYPDPFKDIEIRYPEETKKKRDK